MHIATGANYVSRYCPEKIINLVASIEQSSDMETMSFKKAIGHLNAYENQL